jgi:hypothetical protein
MEPNEPTGTPSRRRALHLGAGLVAATPALLAAGGTAAAREPGKAALKDPTDAYPKAPFKRQTQAWPGLASKMDPRPDHGEASYKGSGRLAGRKALITGGD